MEKPRMNYSYLIIDDNQESILKTKAIADSFSELAFVASANNYNDGLNLILEHNPQLVFLEIDPVNTESNLSLMLINELYRFLTVIPKIIVLTTKKDLAFEAIQYQVTDYVLKPVKRIDFVKLILKLKKSNTAEVIVKTPLLRRDEPPEFLDEQAVVVKKSPLILCVKSYGDYRYIDADAICYLRADNNSTDIHLSSGEMVTAFKTLKHFEAVLSSPFIRIHNSYIVNRNYISRIHTGNAVCHIKNTTTRLPFSKSYKINVEQIISDFSNGNYLEI
jgi:DNA-binding LytR/AlgR family response regulator